MSKDSSATEMGRLANKADVNFFIWMEFTTIGGILGWAQRAEWGCTADRSLWIFARWKKQPWGKVCATADKDSNGCPRKVWGPSSDPVEIKDLSSDIFMTQPVLDWPWAFPKKNLLKGFSSTPLAPVRGQTQQGLNLLDPFLNLWGREMRFFSSPWTSIKEGNSNFHFQFSLWFWCQKLLPVWSKKH